MKEYKKKWNNYNVGNIEWVNVNRSHPCRKKFIEYILKSDISSIVEIGAGELIEGKIIKQKKPTLSYNVMDVSDTFLDYCKSIDGIVAHKGDMIDPPFEDKQFDLVYMSSVLAHSPDIKKTIKEMARISKTFYFNMFKWANESGGLESRYFSIQGYFSTYFNIDMLMELISEYGEIEKMFISYRDNDSKYKNFKKYRKKSKIDLHRTGNYLTIRGNWNSE